MIAMPLRPRGLLAWEPQPKQVIPIAGSIVRNDGDQIVVQLSASAADDLRDALWRMMRLPNEVFLQIVHNHHLTLSVVEGDVSSYRTGRDVIVSLTPNGALWRLLTRQPLEVIGMTVL